MPIKWIVAFNAMMSTIRAEEALHAASVYAVAAGNMKKPDSQRQQRQWRRDASRHPWQGGQKKKDRKLDRAALLAMGICVKVKGGKSA